MRREVPDNAARFRDDGFIFIVIPGEQRETRDLPVTKNSLVQTKPEVAGNYLAAKNSRTLAMARMMFSVEFAYENRT